MLHRDPHRSKDQLAICVHENIDLLSLSSGVGGYDSTLSTNRDIEVECNGRLRH